MFTIGYVQVSVKLSEKLNANVFLQVSDATAAAGRVPPSRFLQHEFRFRRTRARVERRLAHSGLQSLGLEAFPHGEVSRRRAATDLRHDFWRRGTLRHDTQPPAVRAGGQACRLRL